MSLSQFHKNTRPILLSFIVNSVSAIFKQLTYDVCVLSKNKMQVQKKIQKLELKFFYHTCS